MVIRASGSHGRSVGGQFGKEQFSQVVTVILDRVVQILLERGHQPPVLISANVPGGREADEKLRQQYAGRIR
jgi:uncharacterized phosphosugar-binding protein